MSDRYAVVTLDELASDQPGGANWHAIRRTLGVQAFGINAWTAVEDGQQVIGEHDEADGGLEHEEIYLVVSGHATFTLDGEEFDAPAGTLVHVPDPAVKRGATGTRGTTILAVGAKPGVVFTPSSWERSADALRYWPTEEWDKAIALLEEHLAETPSSGVTFYNLACALGRAGRREDALARIREAVTTEDRFLELAQTDDDLASIRDDPSFPRP